MLVADVVLCASNVYCCNGFLHRVALGLMINILLTLANSKLVMWGKDLIALCAVRDI
jgi:hypothetical protein